MGTTDWICEPCGEFGTVEYDDAADVYEVIHLIEDAHEAKTAMPHHFDIAQVRVTLHGSGEPSRGAQQPVPPQEYPPEQTD